MHLQINLWTSGAQQIRTRDHLLWPPLRHVFRSIDTIRSTQPKSRLAEGGAHLPDQPTAHSQSIRSSASPPSRLRPFLSISSTHSVSRIPKLHPSSKFIFKQHHLTSNPIPNLTFRQKCLPKLQRKSLPLVAKPQLEKHLLLRRRKPARKLPQLHLVTRRSVERPGRRPTALTSTRVCLTASRVAFDHTTSIICNPN